MPKSEYIPWLPVDLTWQKAASGAFSIPSNVMIIPSMFQQGYNTPLDAHKPGLVKPVKGDGNCLFRSFSYVITGSEEHHLDIRHWVCEYINLYREKIEKFSGKQNYVSVSKMAKPGVWGTDIEIMAVGSILDTNVYTYTKHGSSQCWLKLSKSALGTPSLIRNKSDRQIYLYHSGSHFEPTVSI